MTAPSSPVPAVEAASDDDLLRQAFAAQTCVLFAIGRDNDQEITAAKARLEVLGAAVLARMSTPTPRRAAEPDTMGDPWVDTRLVSFDDTVMFGQGYDGFDQWDDFRMEMHVPGAGSYAVWGSGKKWSFYGGPNGVMAFERFGSRAEAQREAEDYALSVSEWGRTHHALRTRAETAEAQLATLRAEVDIVIPSSLREASGAAFPGPWFFRNNKKGLPWIGSHPDDPHCLVIVQKESMYRGAADYAFVASLVNWFRALCDMTTNRRPDVAAFELVTDVAGDTFTHAPDGWLADELRDTAEMPSTLLSTSGADR
jgi:hypothetical protein